MSASTWMSRRAASVLLLSLCIASLPALAGPRGGSPEPVAPPVERVPAEAAPINVTTPVAADVTTVGPDGSIPESVVVLVPQPERGKLLAERCASCHGEAGVGMGTLAPKLAGLDAAYLQKATQDLRSGARTTAPEAGTTYKDLTDQDIVDLSAFFAASIRYREPRGDAAIASKGKKLYLMGRVADDLPPCVSCHGSRGDGYVGVIPGGLPGIGAQRSEYIAAQLRAYRDGARTTDHNGMMKFATTHLDEGDVQALATYIQGLVPEGVVAPPKAAP